MWAEPWVGWAENEEVCQTRGRGKGGLTLEVRRLRWISATCEGDVLYYLVLRDN